MKRRIAKKIVKRIAEDPDAGYSRQQILRAQRRMQVSPEQLPHPVRRKLISDMTVPELRQEAKTRGFKGYSKMKKHELMELVGL